MSKCGKSDNDAFAFFTGYSIRITRPNSMEISTVQFYSTIEARRVAEEASIRQTENPKPKIKKMFVKKRKAGLFILLVHQTS